MSIFAITIALSVLTFVFIGSYAGRQVKTLDDYYVAGRRAPTFLIVGTLVASNMSTTVFMGEAGFTYAGQLGPYLLLPGLTVIGYAYGALFFGTFLRRSRATTVAAFFGERFASPELQQIAGWTIILGLGGYLLVVTQGAALLLSDLTGISYEAGIAIAWLSYSVFTLYAGSKGVVITDTLMFLLFTGASMFVAIHLLEGFGGISQTIQDLTRLEEKPDLTSWHGTIGEGTAWPTALDFLIWIVVIDLSWSLVYAVSPWQSSRHLMAKSEHVVLRASIYTVLVVIFLQLAIYGAGGFVNLANPNIENEETVLIWAATHLVPALLGAVLVAGIVCAALSSASTFLSLIGFSASNDLTVKTSATNLNRTRLAMASISAVVLVLSLFLPHDLFWITLFIGTVFASSWGPVGLMSIWSRSITARGARWGMIAGLLANIAPAALDYLGFIDLPSYLEPVLLGIVASIMFTYLGSRGDAITQQERDYLAFLHRTPAEDISQDATRITLVAPMLLIAYGCLMPFLLLHFYVEPYQIGAGVIAVGESIDWSGLEPWFVLGPLVIHVPLGVVAWRVIRKRYTPEAA
ncbi:MAG: sodium:solute symporter family protein [Luminiphilus sp.]|nr:sodium:solute symporter family protein [Luminiphilus sp.]MBL6898000.1 sodium:solute symporter family protein [Luminiphilus sp.]